MAKSASVITRVDPKIKEQAENVLTQLGISMGTAMEIYLRQIALQRKIPFEISLPVKEPIVLSNLTDEEFNAMMDKSVRDYNNGNYVTAKEFDVMLKKDYGV